MSEYYNSAYNQIRSYSITGVRTPEIWGYFQELLRAMVENPSMNEYEQEKFVEDLMDYEYNHRTRVVLRAFISNIERMVIAHSNRTGEELPDLSSLRSL